VNVVLFYHSLASDWNHGNAHFLRGFAWELKSRGHDVRVYEPAEGWSRHRLLQEHGAAPIESFYRAYPGLRSSCYRLEAFELERELRGADLVLVHEWNDPELVRRIGSHRAASGGYCLLFHDTHHRAVTQPESLSGFDLSAYDGVLAYGKALADVYQAQRWARRVWVWHEAADTRVFQPCPATAKDMDLVWIGNWGDDERATELEEFLLGPVRSLKLKARVYGVRYPEIAIKALAAVGIEYHGWLPNFRVPEVFARARITVHIPRGPYVTALPGIPTIRPFEALACGIPLISAPWRDCENLFTPGADFLFAHSGAEMERLLKLLLSEPARARALVRHGHETILRHHTCAHRVDQLLTIFQEIAADPARAAGREPRSGEVSARINYQKNQAL
jgi:spore maturation protein CgeB